MSRPHRSRWARLAVRMAAIASLIFAAGRPAGAQVSLEVLQTLPGGTDASPLVLSALVEGTDENFYGTTQRGGSAGVGTIYRITPAGSLTVLHEFAGGTADGAAPQAALILATDGNFYGTTATGGAADLGTVFRMTPSGGVTIVHAFSGGSTDGANPRAALVQGSDGDLYGTTYAGGAANLGTIFRMTMGGAVTLLHAFVGGSTDGANPTAALIQAIDGNFYGTTTAGGGTNSGLTVFTGTVFRMSPGGSMTILHVFTSVLTLCCRGREPRASLIQAADGNLYGTTRGIVFDFGSVFVLTPDGTFSTLMSSPQGSESALIQAVDGNLYGSIIGNFGSAGTIFSMAPGGHSASLQTLPATVGKNSSGQYLASLIQATDWRFYGTTGTGLVFRFTVTPQAPAVGTVQSHKLAGVRTASLSVAVSGLPTPRVQWQVSSNDGASWTNVTDGGPYSGARTSTLVVNVPTRAFNRYQFRAVAINGVGTATGNAATLAVPVVVGNFLSGTRTDFAIFRPSSGTWFIDGYTFPAPAWGLPGDVPVTGDYDGDILADLGVYRPTTGVWYIRQSSSNLFATSVAYTLGAAGDLPVPADYDGDGKTDPAVYRPSTGIWYILPSTSSYATTMTIALGRGTDIPVPADYDGDGDADVAVFRPSTGMWYVRQSSTGFATAFAKQWGLTGDIPVPGDYDGDGKSDLAVYRPAEFVWYVLQSSTGYSTSKETSWGLSGDILVPGDYDGDGKTDVAVYRPSNAVWYVLRSSLNFTARQWGLRDDIPVPNAAGAYAVASLSSRPTTSALASRVRASDRDGDGRSDLTVYRPSTGTWFTLPSSTSFMIPSPTFTLGVSTDTPVTGDFDGDGKTDAAVFTPATGMWAVRRSTLGTSQYQWGLNGDVPVPGDYDGDGKTDIAVYRPSNGVWYMMQSSTNLTTFVTFQWGLSGDVTAPGDYDGDGVTDLVVYRPSTGVWHVLQSTAGYATFQWGLHDDITVPGDYDGDGRSDLGVYRPSTGVWFSRLSSTNFTTFVMHQWGLSGDTPVPGDFDGDGKTDVAVWRPSSGVWYLLRSSSNFTTSASYQWGLNGDVPILQRR